MFKEDKEAMYEYITSFILVDDHRSGAESFKQALADEIADGWKPFLTVPYELEYKADGFLGQMQNEVVIVHLIISRRPVVDEEVEIDEPELLTPDNVTQSEDSDEADDEQDEAVFNFESPYADPFIIRIEDDLNCQSTDGSELKLLFATSYRLVGTHRFLDGIQWMDVGQMVHEITTS